MTTQLFQCFGKTAKVAKLQECNHLNSLTIADWQCNVRNADNRVLWNTDELWGAISNHPSLEFIHLNNFGDSLENPEFFSCNGCNQEAKGGQVGGSASLDLFLQSPTPHLSVIGFEEVGVVPFGVCRRQVWLQYRSKSIPQVIKII
jgi:hypothetical protein